MQLTDLLRRPIAFHRPLVDVTKSITAALMLSQALYWNPRTGKNDGWFFKTQEEWTKETGMSRAEQETARKSLLNLDVWEERYDRLLHRMWYRVKTEQLSRMLESYCPECDFPAFGNEEIPHSSNLTETSTETPPTPPKVGDTEFLETWNQSGLPKILVLSGGRKSKLLARLKEPFFRDNWKDAIARIAKSRFCMGENDRKWKADIEFFLRPDSVAKAMEGKYDNGKGKERNCL